MAARDIFLSILRIYLNVVERGHDPDLELRLEPSMGLKSDPQLFSHLRCWPTLHTCDGSGQGPRWAARLSQVFLGSPIPSDWMGQPFARYWRFPVLGAPRSVHVSWECALGFESLPFNSGAINVLRPTWDRVTCLLRPNSLASGLPSPVYIKDRGCLTLRVSVDKKAPKEGLTWGFLSRSH